MGIDYNQYCMIGVSTYLKDIKILDAPAVYEEQSRYNPKTGKETHKEKVLVKEEQYHYEWLGRKFDDYMDLDFGEEIGGVEYDYNEGDPTLFVGEALMGNTGLGYSRIDLLSGEVSLYTIKTAFERVSKSLNVKVDDLKMIFYYYVG